MVGAWKLFGGNAETGKPVTAVIRKNKGGTANFSALRKERYFLLYKE